MKYLIAIIILIILATTYFLFLHKSGRDLSQGQELMVSLGGQSFAVELADTAIKRAQGLSGRDPLADNTGMFFVFDTPGKNGFWMKDMKFDIDIIWIRDDRVVDIWANAPAAFKNSQIATYRPKTAANYVLEVKAGFVDSSGLEIGDKVSIGPVRDN